MSNDEGWRVFPLDDWFSAEIKRNVRRGHEGREIHGDVFQGDPIAHALEEVTDLAYYLHVIQRKVASLEGSDSLREGLNAFSKRCYETAKHNGWHDFERTFGDEVALIHSEVSEALEEYRLTGEPTSEKVVEELADIIIRVADLVGKHNIDIESAIERKMEKNKERPYRHGNKAL